MLALVWNLVDVKFIGVQKREREKGDGRRVLLQDCFQNSYNLVYLEQSEILLCGTTEDFSKGRRRNVFAFQCLL